MSEPTYWDTEQGQAEQRAFRQLFTPRDWRGMRPAAFDTDAKPQPLTLFPEPDRAGTPDLFTEE